MGRGGATAGRGGATAGSGGRGGSAGSAAGTTGSGGGGGTGGALANFSFFVTSIAAIRAMTDVCNGTHNEQGLGGDLRCGETGTGAGLRGADKICAATADRAWPGAGSKAWRAFLSTTAGGANGGPVHARDRIGTGPWHDAQGRLVASSLSQLLMDRPADADPAIKNDLPNEYGIPNHTDGAPGCTTNCPDNHDVLTGTGADGMLYMNSQASTCNDWTSSATAGSPRCGHSWPRTHWDDFMGVYAAIVARVGAAADLDRGRLAVFPSWQLEAASWGAGLQPTTCVSATTVERIKRFYLMNETAGVPFQVNLSAYPEDGVGGVDAHERRLAHLLDSLHATEGVACDKNGDGAVAPGEGFLPSEVVTRVSLPTTVPLSYGEASRPGWLALYARYDAATIAEVEHRGAAYVSSLLNYRYSTPAGEPAYPIDHVVFTSGPEWVFPVTLPSMERAWAHFSGGLSRSPLAAMYPKPGALLVDSVLDASRDGDWDNDGVDSIAVSFEDAGQRDSIRYVRDNCPYHPNPDQSDADGDGIGDACDNCVRVANYGQDDHDQDGIGNVCDVDLNDDGLVDAFDRSVIAACINETGRPALDCLEALPGMSGKVVLIADLDGDEHVTSADLAAWDASAARADPRPSAFDCAGQIPCPDPRTVMLPDGSVATIPD